LLIVGYRLSVIGCWLSVVGCRLSVVGLELCQVPVIKSKGSPVLKSGYENKDNSKVEKQNFQKKCSSQT